ncbi:MAG: DUF4924 family protein [Muribaculaceae bacterium]|nr:DUF4924 family protein [Muribaculaceae bacterium]
MYIASHKRKENIAEYILYMWQIEDIIRANDCDIDRIKANIIDRSGLDEARRNEMTEWYESLIDMMRREGVTKSGHLQLNHNILNQLVQLHQALLADPAFPEYTAEFYKTLPYIVELRSKAGDSKVGEIETCFTALYGMLMMRLQKKEIGPDTQEAIKQITRFIALLAKDFHLDEQDKLFKHDDNEPAADNAAKVSHGANPLVSAENAPRPKAEITSEGE